LRYIVLQHQDPDFCASTPLFEQHGFRGQIATHWRAANLIQFYGVKSSFYLVDEHEWQLRFGQERILNFIATPYLHFAGAIATYDPQTKVLFSSDLFGAFAGQTSLYADEWPNNSYLESMLSFHENYMPSNKNLRPVMEKLSKMAINLIAPQHGAIIRKDIAGHIQALQELECGSFLTPIQHELSAIDGYTKIANQVLKRYYASYSVQQVAEILSGSGIKIDPETGVIADFNCSGRELWDQIFQLMYDRKGGGGLLFIAPFVQKLSDEYSIELPSIFRSTVLALEQQNQQCSLENRQLIEKSTRLTKQLDQASETLLRCPITNLRNEKVLHQYLEFQQQVYLETLATGFVLIIGVDNMARINLQYGSSIGNEILQTLAYLIDEAIEPSHALFKVEGPVFACCLSEGDRQSALQLAEKIRVHIEQSDRMIEKSTISIAVADLQDFFRQTYSNGSQFSSVLLTAGRTQLMEARRLGGNRIVMVNETDQKPPSGKILLVDTDAMHLEVLGTILRVAGYKIFVANDGEAAFEMVERESPELIISEIMLPKTDGFLLRQRLRATSAQQQIPFILLSFQKNDENIQRAFALDIEHYFQKPYILSELIGLIQLKFRQLSVTTS
jgi:diguanylate cyclase (GGDEF)-like protein